MQQPELVQRLAVQGLELLSSTPQELGVSIVSEINKYRDIIQRAGIKTE